MLAKGHGNAGKGTGGDQQDGIEIGPSAGHWPGRQVGSVALISQASNETFGISDRIIAPQERGSRDAGKQTTEFMVRTRKNRVGTAHKFLLRELGTAVWRHGGDPSV